MAEVSADASNRGEVVAEVSADASNSGEVVTEVSADKSAVDTSIFLGDVSADGSVTKIGDTD